MSEPVLLFPYLDIAMRAVAVLILCALPLLLMPEPTPRPHAPRNRHRPAASKSSPIGAITSD